MPCRPLHAMHCLHLADLNSMHCSHTASWSIQPRLRLSLLILPSTTSVSISTTPGAFTWNLPLWIFVGQIIIRAIPLRYAILTGLKAKNSGSLMKFEISTIQINRILCAWAATGHSQTQTCCRDSLLGKMTDLLVASYLLPCGLDLFLSFFPCGFVSFLLA